MDLGDARKLIMVSAEGSKLFDGQCMGGGIFVSLEKIFVFNYS